MATDKKKLETGNLGQGTGDRELFLHEWRRCVCRLCAEVTLVELRVSYRPEKTEQSKQKRELGAGNWRTGTGGCKLGIGNLGQRTRGSKLDRELGNWGTGTGNKRQKTGAENWQAGWEQQTGDRKLGTGK